MPPAPARPALARTQYYRSRRPLAHHRVYGFDRPYLSPLRRDCFRVRNLDCFCSGLGATRTTHGVKRRGMADAKRHNTADIANIVNYLQDILASIFAPSVTTGIFSTECHATPQIIADLHHSRLRIGRGSGRPSPCRMQEGQVSDDPATSDGWIAATMPIQNVLRIEAKHRTMLQFAQMLERLPNTSVPKKSWACGGKVLGRGRVPGHRPSLDKVHAKLRRVATSPSGTFVQQSDAYTRAGGRVCGEAARGLRKPVRWTARGSAFGPVFCSTSARQLRRRIPPGPIR